MTEKVKIPQNIADAIEKMKEVHTNYGVVQALAVGKLVHPSTLLGAVNTLRVWTHDEEGDGRNADRLLDVLVNGYEIEPEPLKVGDWATRKKGRRIIKRSSDLEGAAFQIEEISGLGALGSDGNAHALGALRHATTEEIKVEKERQLWKSMGRGVGEFRDGDIGVARNGSLLTNMWDIKTHQIHGDLVGLYPTEAAITLGRGEV